MKRRSSIKEIIVVAGVTGAGKSTFSYCFKDSFLKSYPVKNLTDGIKENESFATELSLVTDTQIEYLRSAHEEGFQITIYYLFTGKLLAQERAFLRTISLGIPFDETIFRNTYDDSYNGLIACYDFVDLVFFVKNQKAFEFIAAFDPKSVSESTFENNVIANKRSIDKLK